MRFMSRLLSSYYTNKSTGLRHCASSTSLIKHNPIRRRRTESLIPLQDCYIFRAVQGHAIITYYYNTHYCAIANSRESTRDTFSPLCSISTSELN